jgi:hypothetical protein
MRNSSISYWSVFISLKYENFHRIWIAESEKDAKEIVAFLQTKKYYWNNFCKVPIFKIERED